MAEHFTDCWRHHYPCALLRIWDLEKEVQRLTTQLQYERTGHLVEQGINFHQKTFVPGVGIAIPCHDHIEPPIVSGGPTWAHRPDDPPSLTP